MKRYLLALILVLGLASLLTSSALALEYSFSLDEETVQVFWNSDGTISVDYSFTFTNDPGAHPIDFVDIGMPNRNFDWNSIVANVNGQTVNISEDYQGKGPYGFAVDLGPYAIPAGKQGKVHAYIGRISNVLHPDDNEPDTYASGEFSPTWFGADYVHGYTKLTVVFLLPPGVKPQEPRYHMPRGGWPCSDQPLAQTQADGRILYTWSCPTAQGHTQYTFGISFPKQYVPASAIAKPSLFRIDPETIIAALCIGGIIFFFLGIPILGIISERKRKLQYLPPKISVEGHGIKRGLTAVEAAILMEQPLDKVMTMILFGVVKKGAATVASSDPLKLQVTDPLPANLHEYEQEFLQAFATANLAARRQSLQEMTIRLVKSVAEKMKGFSRKETIDYYKSIMERAWQQIEAAGTPEVKSQMYEQALEWTMLDKEYDERTRQVLTGPVYVPHWWGRYDPSYRSASSAHTAAPAPSMPSGAGRSQVSVPGASFAASVVNGVQRFSSRILGDVHSFTSSVTNRTNPVPSPSGSSSSSWSGGGHSCACACACAGCACACAGGGR